MFKVVTFDCLFRFLLFLHQALGPKDCCDSPALVFPSLPGSPTVSSSLKLLAHNLSGNSIFNPTLHVAFPVLSGFVNDVIQIFHV
jgi:hypothetical protein